MIQPAHPTLYRLELRQNIYRSTRIDPCVHQRFPAHRVRLQLTENRTIDGGCVFMNYRVQPG